MIHSANRRFNGGLIDGIGCSRRRKVSESAMNKVRMFYEFYGQCTSIGSIIFRYLANDYLSPVFQSQTCYRESLLKEFNDTTCNLNSSELLFDVSPRYADICVFFITHCYHNHIKLLGTA